MIEIRKAWTGTFMKVRKSLVVDVERNVSIGKKDKMVKIYE